MKILIVLDRLEILGGLELHITTLAKELYVKGNEIILYTNAISEHFRKELKNINQIVGFNDKNDKSIILYSPEIIHAHPFTAIEVGLKIADKCPKSRFFITMHGNYNTGLTKAAIDRAEDIVFVSETAYAASKSLLPSNKGQIIYNPIDTTKFKKRIKHRNALNLLNKDYKTIVVVSRVADGKEIPIMQFAKIIPELANRISGLNVIFIGGGAKLSELQSYLDTLTFTNVNIKTLGEVANVAMYLQVADLVLGCDRCAIEAILCEKIVFYMGLSKWKSLVEESNYFSHLFTTEGLTDYTDEQLTQHLTWMLTQEEIVRKSIGNLSEKIKDICSEYVIADKYTELYKKKG
jgi:glycosyltransferase involved in cell wall biosynthesis